MSIELVMKYGLACPLFTQSQLKKRFGILLGTEKLESRSLVVK